MAPPTDGSEYVRLFTVCSPDPLQDPVLLGGEVFSFQTALSTQLDEASQLHFELFQGGHVSQQLSGGSGRTHHRPAVETPYLSAQEIHWNYRLGESSRFGEMS